MSKPQLVSSLFQRCRCDCGRHISGGSYLSQRSFHNSLTKSADPKDRSRQRPTGGRPSRPAQGRSDRRAAPDTRRSEPKEGENDSDTLGPYNKIETAYVRERRRGQEKAQVNFVPERNEDVDTWRVLTAVEREAISTLSERKESLTRAGDEADAKPETEEEKKQRQDMILQKIIGGSYDHVSLPNRLNREVEGVGQIKPGSVLAEVERVLQGNGTYRTGDVDSLLTRVRKNVGDTARRK